MFDECIYFNTQALGRQLDRIWTRAFRPFGLTPPQGFMLRAILNRPGMLQSELADTLKIARATATRALDGLGSRMLIERRGTERDGRESEIWPTPDAEIMRNSLNAASVSVTAHIKRILGDSRFGAFVDEAKDILKTLT